MINLTTFQIKIIKFYLLPILTITFLLSLFINYNFQKFFRDGVEFNNKIETIKEIQRKNIVLNGVELKKWTTLTDTQKEFFLNNEKEKLEDKEKFKIRYKIEEIKDYINDDNIEEQYNFIIFIKSMFQGFFFSIFSIILLFLIPRFSLYKFYKDYYLTKLKPLEKFYNLPFYLNSLTSNINLNDKERINYIDKFLKYDENNNCYLYKTYSITQKNIYENNIKDIENYLNLQNLKITQTDLIIKIEEKKIKKMVQFDKNDYKENMLFLGEREHGKKIYLNILGLKHTIIIGESGSGKSVFIQNILLSIFKNLNLYEKIYLVDFKLVEMSRYKNKNEKIEVISGINQFTQKVKEIETIMWDRYKFMELNNLTTFNGNGILVFIDEFRSLENNSLEKEEKKEMVKSLIELLQKRRRRKIFLIFRGQKRDTRNINSSVVSNIMNRILLKTTNNDNITKIGGNREELESNGISINEIKNFNRGRLFYKDGDSGENFLIQSPFFNVEDKEQSNFMFSLIDNNNIKNIENIEKNDEIFASFEEEKTEKIEVLTEINLNDLEEIRLKKWKETYNLESKTEQSQKRKILFQVKKMIEKNELEERKNILNTL
ncbi:MAG: FtsK/SpoIIIE domain-containing protein [Aliarcobacter sp.]|nr:FtsK/SpoIIIE domain-containing protein [Aliarcobacter sp.]